MREFSKFRRRRLVLIMHKRGQLLCQSTLQSLGMPLEEDNVPAASRLAQLTAATENPEPGGKWGGNPSLGQRWSWWRGWKGFRGTGTEGGMCLETNPAVLKGREEVFKVFKQTPKCGV